MSLHARYRAASRPHAGLILVSTKTFPEDRAFVTAVTSALNSLLAAEAPSAGDVAFLPRA
jgi:hypothetical protein